MADWTLEGGAQLTQTAPPAATLLSNGCRGISVQASATAATYGSWVQFTGSAVSNVLAFDACGFYLSCDHYGGTGNADDSRLIDIGIGVGGAAPTTANVVSQFAFVWPRADSQGLGCYIPIAIAAGAEVWMRTLSIFGSTPAAYHTLTFFGQTFDPYPPCNVVQSLGNFSITANGAVAFCAELDPYSISAATAVAEGSWVTLGTTTCEVQQVILSANQTALNAGTPDSTGITARWFVDIGIGATPDVIVTNLCVSTTSVYDAIQQQFLGPFPLYIPAGTAVKARCMTNKSNLTANASKLGFILYAFS